MEMAQLVRMYRFWVQGWDWTGANGRMEKIKATALLRIPAYDVCANERDEILAVVESSVHEAFEHFFSAFINALE